MSTSSVFLAMAVVCLLTVVPAGARVSGPCSDCHTMHNSQDGSSLNFDNDATPNLYLTRGSCVGCHAQGPTRIVSVTGSQIPQVMHTDPIDLAAGNFAYIYGGKGSGEADSKGHNVIDLGAADAVLMNPPGSWHGKPLSTDFTCAGTFGCHGGPVDDPFASIAGAHHADDSVLTGQTVGKSYRFLKGVTGLEAADWQNTDSEHHNEYHDHATPVDPTCNGCHFFGLPAGSSISDLCVRCHRDMHNTDTGGNQIWIRHPTSIVLPASGEYANYTNYNVDAPIGRVTLPESASSLVTPGTDVVTCLSCHFSHASDYSDMLRWDYSQNIAGGGSNETGCFICHSTKDE